MRAQTWILLALASLLALPAAAQTPTRRGQVPARRNVRDLPNEGRLPNLEIKNVFPKGISGRRLELELHLYRPGQAMRQDVEVYWVQNARKTRLWSGKAQFNSARGGFRHTLTVNLGNRNLNLGRVQVVAKACEALARCKKELRISKGDLRFDGTTSFLERGTLTDINLKVKNFGPVNFGSCRVELKVGSKVEKAWSLRGIRNGSSVPLKWTYGRNLRGKRFEAEIKCADLTSGNNKRKGSLR